MYMGAMLLAHYLYNSMLDLPPSKGSESIGLMNKAMTKDANLSHKSGSLLR